LRRQTSVSMTTAPVQKSNQQKHRVLGSISTGCGTARGQ
jgi:hypothetical protein